MFVVLTGENGAGKTNILEAVSMLAPGRGLRGSLLRDMARQDGPGNFSIAAQVDDIMIGTGTAIDAPDRRLVRINGASASASALGEWLSILWLTPAMDRLFQESPGGRSEEHTSELQSLMRISYAVFCLKTKTYTT